MRIDEPEDAGPWGLLWVIIGLPFLTICAIAELLKFITGNQND